VKDDAFESLARSLTVASTRRRAVGLVSGGIVGGLTGLLGLAGNGQKKEASQEEATVSNAVYSQLDSIRAALGSMRGE
jgi:hypothetical protein